MMLLLQVISSRGYEDSELNALSTIEKEWPRIPNSKTQVISSKSHRVPPYCIKLVVDPYEEWKRNSALKKNMKFSMLGDYVKPQTINLKHSHFGKA